MKSFYVLFLPRQVQALFLLLCSCHMLLLLNLVKGPITSTHSEETLHLSGAKVNGISEESFRSSHSLQTDDKHFSRELTSHHWQQTRKSHSDSRTQSALLIKSNLPKAHTKNNHHGNSINSKTAPKDFEPKTVPPEFVRKHFENESQTQQKEILSYSQNATNKFTASLEYSNQNLSTDESNILQASSSASILEFPYLINQPYLCSPNEDMNDSVHSIIIAMSHPFNKAQRDAIRNTWGRRIQHNESRIQLRLVFVLGVSDLVYSSAEQFKRVQHEAKLYRDIIMGEFNDTYTNLTLKSLFALQWVRKYCNQTKYTIKTDDDTFVNTQALRQFLQEERNESIIGALNVNAEVMRTGLWKVPKNQYSNSIYPPYCTGCIYVLSTQIINSLLNSAKSIQTIPIEDAYITGLLAQANGYVCTNNKKFPQWFAASNYENNCKLLHKQLIALHNVPYEIMYKLQDIIHSKNSSEYCSHKEYDKIS